MTEIEDMPYPQIAAGIKAAMEAHPESVGVFGLPIGGADDIRVMIAISLSAARKVGDSVMAFGLTESGIECVLDGLLAVRKMIAESSKSVQVQ